MPGIDGFASCRRLKAEMATRDIPVIFMTALADTDSKVAGFAAGGVDFVTKPLHMAEVLARIDTHLTLSVIRATLACQNRQLQDAVAKREKLNSELERRVAERTQQLEDALQRSRRLNADKEVLLAEVHHRVKNNLQAVCTLILLKAYQFPDAAVQQAFTDTLARVSAMRLVHEALYAQEDCSQVDFRAYLERLANALTGIYGCGDDVRLSIESEEARLDLVTAVPAGLIVAEAIANAMKHAFPNGRRGTIALQFHATPAGKMLCIRDDGVGLPGCRATAAGTGMGLMKTLANQIHGQLAWSSHDGGTTVTMTFA
jgi:two-component sensor histidine kinase